MSMPIKKLMETCDILGKKCHDLVKARKDEQINDLGFITGYFDMLAELPDTADKEIIMSDLEEFVKKTEG